MRLGVFHMSALQQRAQKCLEQPCNTFRRGLSLFDALLTAPSQSSNEEFPIVPQFRSLWSYLSLSLSVCPCLLWRALWLPGSCSFPKNVPAPLHPCPLRKQTPGPYSSSETITQTATTTAMGQLMGQQRDWATANDSLKAVSTKQHEGKSNHPDTTSCTHMHSVDTPRFVLTYNSVLYGVMIRDSPKEPGKVQARS